MPESLITSDPKIMMGKPTVAGTRITVELILEKLAAGETVGQILSEHPRLTEKGIRAAIALARGNATDALANLQVTLPYELGGGAPPFSAGASMYPVYLRGEAYLRLKRWGNAAGEFRKIIDHRGLVWFPLDSLAHLQLARAQANLNPTAARDAYQHFLELWQDADVPILSQAKREYARLQ